MTGFFMGNLETHYYSSHFFSVCKYSELQTTSFKMYPETLLSCYLETAKAQLIIESGHMK